MIAFTFTILFMYVFFAYTFKIFSRPEEYVILNKVTGRRMVVSHAEIQELERKLNLETLNMIDKRESQQRTRYPQPNSNQNRIGGPFGERNDD